MRNVAAEARAMAAERVFGYGSVDDLKAVEPAITITAEHSTGPNEVSTAFETQQKAVFAALSKSGTCWVLTAPLDEQADTKPEGHELAPGELCRAGFVNLSPLVLSAVLVHPDGSETLTWEEDPEASYYEVCTDTGCSTTPTPSFTVSPGSGSVYVRAIRPNGSASSGYSYGSGGSGGSGGPATPPPAPDDDEPITATLDGTTVALSWGTSGPDAELYRVYRCAVGAEPWPGESCGVLAVLPATEAATYSHADDVAALIADGVELVRYQVVASAGIYQVASNWAEVELPSGSASPAPVSFEAVGFLSAAGLHSGMFSVEDGSGVLRYWAIEYRRPSPPDGPTRNVRVAPMLGSTFAEGLAAEMTVATLLEFEPDGSLLTDPAEVLIMADTHPVAVGGHPTIIIDLSGLSIGTPSGVIYEPAD